MGSARSVESPNKWCGLLFAVLNISAKVQMQAHVDFVQYDKTIAELRNITSNLDATSRWRVFLVRLILTFKIISYCESLLDPCGGLRMKARAILVCSSVEPIPSTSILVWHCCAQSLCLHVPLPRSAIRRPGNSICADQSGGAQ